MKIEVRKEPYIITNGNGGTLQAKIVEKTKAPPRIRYCVRKGGKGRFGALVHTVTIPAFRKLVAAAE